MLYDLAIIGGGPAGVAGGVYAARKKLKTIFITENFGGQSVVSPDIQNWIGTISVSGEEFAKRLRAHLFVYQAPDFVIKEGERVANISENADQTFTLHLATGEDQTRTILTTAGSSRRKLTVPGADKFEQKGITYCASCDGPLFADKEVVVIGGGNAGFESALQLLAYCPKVTLLHHNDQLKADPVTVERAKKNPKFALILNAETQEIKGRQFVQSLIYREVITGESKEIPTTGIFVEIGLVPNTVFIKDLVKLNQYKMIVVDPRTQLTSHPRIWAAGDATDGLYHQNNIAAGDAVKAVENIYQSLALGN